MRPPAVDVVTLYNKLDDGVDELLFADLLLLLLLLLELVRDHALLTELMAGSDDVTPVSSCNWRGDGRGVNDRRCEGVLGVDARLEAIGCG